VAASGWPGCGRSERDAGRLPPWLPGIAPRLAASGAVAVSTETTSPVCSAKGCKAPATWVLAWNNPKLHAPERRKTWTACDDHREHLTGFLETRGFLRQTVPYAEWPADEPT